MTKQARNKQLEMAKKKVFEAEVILSEIMLDEDTCNKMKDDLTDVMFNHTRLLMDKIDELYYEDVRKRKIKPTRL